MSIEIQCMTEKLIVITIKLDYSKVPSKSTVSTYAFRSSGIHPFNPDVFPNDAFLPALVTDIPLQLDEADSSTAPSTSESAATFTNVAERQTLNDEKLLVEINAYPKANVSQKRPNKRRCKSAIITDTPEKKLVSRCKKVQQKRPEKTVSSSSERDISIHLLSDSTSDNESTTSTISATTSSRGSGNAV